MRWFCSKWLVIWQRMHGCGLEREFHRVFLPLVLEFHHCQWHQCYPVLQASLSLPKRHHHYIILNLATCRFHTIGPVIPISPSSPFDPMGPFSPYTTKYQSLNLKIWPMHLTWSPFIPFIPATPGPPGPPLAPCKPYTTHCIHTDIVSRYPIWRDII